MTNHHFLFSNHRFRELKGCLSDLNLGGKGWHVYMQLGIWSWVYGLGARAAAHRQTLIPPPPAPLSSGSNRWQVLAQGVLASINRHTEWLPCLEHKQSEGPSAAGGLVELVKALGDSLPKKTANAQMVKVGFLYGAPDLCALWRLIGNLWTICSLCDFADSNVESLFPLVDLDSSTSLDLLLHVSAVGVSFSEQLLFLPMCDFIHFSILRLILTPSHDAWTGCGAGDTFTRYFNLQYF